MLGHYIGRHKDSILNMVCGTPIAAVSLGDQRIFRLTHPNQSLKRYFPAQDATVFLMPYDPNKSWKRGVPKRATPAARGSPSR